MSPLPSLSGLVEDETTFAAGSLGVLTALLMLVGAAFAFSLPRVAQVIFVLAYLCSIPAREDFPDMWVWGIISLVLAVLLLFVKSKKKRETAQ